MVPWRASEEGFVTPAILEWYGRLARGKPAVLVVEATGIRDIASGPLLRIGHDRFIPGLSDLVDAIHEASEGETKVFIQILDFLTIRRRPEKERYCTEILSLRSDHREGLRDLSVNIDFDDDKAVRAALAELTEEKLLTILSSREGEDLMRGLRERVTDMHLPHIQQLPNILPSLFSEAALRARESGFDGVELHFAHAYTMASFLSKLNHRDDGYGGSIEGRVRLPLEVFSAVRQAVGDDWSIGIRFLGEECVEGGSTLEDACAYGVAFAKAGADVLSISRGGKFEDAQEPKVGQAIYPYTGQSGHACMPSVFDDNPPFGQNLPLPTSIRQAIREEGEATPIVATGGINGFHLAEQTLQHEMADLIGAARQSLADPDWWHKMREGRGDSIARCLYTNYCEALDQKHVPVTCQLWDRLLDLGDEPALTTDGRRRLVAPTGSWEPRQSPPES